jgi:hypothetical protein
MATSVDQTESELHGQQQGQREYRYSDAELVAAIDQEIENSVTGDDSDFSVSYAEADSHYHGRAPAAAGSNTSDYVSREVFESVESMKAKLYKTFAGSRDVVRFRPMSEQDVEGARQRTAYVKRQLFHENPGAAILHDFFHDVTKSRLGAIKRYVKETQSVSWQDVRVPLDELQAALDQGTIEDAEIRSVTPETTKVPTMLGPVPTIRRVADARVKQVTRKKRICIEVLDPRNVHIPAGVEDISDARRLPSLVLTYRKRRYELIEEGFDPELVATLDPATGLASTFATETDKIPERNTISSLDEIDIEEAYLRIDMETPRSEPEGVAQLWQIIKSGNTILSKEVVDEIPVLLATAYRVAHEALGLSVAQVTVDQQRGVTNVIRGVIDNVHRVNAGLRIANMDMIRNPRDLVDNPVGGIVDAERTDAISVVPQPGISPSTMALLEIFAAQKEQRTGDTRLSRGLNTDDIITHQNAKDMIAQLIEVGNERPMMLASLLAETVIKPLMLDIWRLGRQYDIPALIEIEGRLQEVSPKQIPEGDEMQVDHALTPEYGQKRAQSTLMLHQLLLTNPVIAPLYQLEEQYAAISEVFDLLGQPNWLANPKDQKVLQRLQLAQQAAQQQQMQQLQLVQAQLQMQDSVAKAQLQKIMAETEKLRAEPRLKKEALDLDAAQGAAKQALEEREFEHQKQVDAAEIRIESQQRRPAVVGVS